MDSVRYECTICGKSFTRDYNRSLHILKRHQPQYVHPAAQSMDGYGVIQKGGNTSVDKRIHTSSYWVVQNEGVSYSVKYKKRRNDYTFKLRSDLKLEEVSDVFKYIELMMQDLITVITKNIPVTDKVNITIDNSSLDFPICLGYESLYKITSKFIMSEISGVLQSNDMFLLNNSFKITVNSVQMDVGGSRKSLDHFTSLNSGILKKKSIIHINNNDSLCLARSLCVGLAYNRNKKHLESNWSRFRKSQKEQLKRATLLHKNSGVPLVKCGISEVKLFQSFLKKFDTQIFVYSTASDHKLLYKGPTASERIYLLFNIQSEHYDLITKITGLFNTPYFCLHCNLPYYKKYSHVCKDICPHCYEPVTSHGVSTGYNAAIYCVICHRDFRGFNCYRLHLKKVGRSDSICNIKKRCLDCGKVHVSKEKHKCGRRCRTCYTIITPGDEAHLCFMQRIKIPEYESDKIEVDENQLFTDLNDAEYEDEPINEKQYKKRLKKRPSYIFFDLESKLDPMPSECGKNFTLEHIPNLCVAIKTCFVCIDNYTKIATKSDIYELEKTSDPRCIECGLHIFEGVQCIKQFCEWIFLPINRKTIILSHNGGSYDLIFVLKQIFLDGRKVKILAKGNGFLSIYLKTAGIRFIDSYNFLPMSLSKLPAIFGIDKLYKGFFPFLLNTTLNQNYSGTMPAMKYFNPDQMTGSVDELTGKMTGEKGRFLTWYNENRDTHFNLKEKLKLYCIQDTVILQKCCLLFRHFFMELTQNIDPFENSYTLPMCCHRFYRTHLLPENSIALIPENGYFGNQNQSPEALKWLLWLEFKHNIKIQKYSDIKGEKVILNFRVDGFHSKSNTAIEYNSCYYHGHNKCYRSDTINKSNRNQPTMGELYTKTLIKAHKIRQTGVKLISKWSCEWEKEVAHDPIIQDFIRKVDIPERLIPRNSFFGGRNESYKVFCEAGPEETIKHLDIVSLYPWVNKYGRYILYHPTVIRDNFNKDLSTYVGLFQCRIIPPRGLLFPVLPSKTTQGKLVFTLCRTCSDKELSEKCNHTDDLRALTGTWVSYEVLAAIKRGYVVTKVFEIWHFKETSKYDETTGKGGLFSPYINIFATEKVKASGYPSNCNSESEKKIYISNYFKKEKIILNPAEISVNPGLRAIAKLALNSFWGKFSLRMNKRLCDVVSSREEMVTLLQSDEVKVFDIIEVGCGQVLITYDYKKPFIPTSSTSNVIIASFTSCMGRLKLLSELEKCGDDLCYTDTDSLIYLSKKGGYNPKESKYLGGLTSELEEGIFIKRFVTAGCKNYSYLLNKPSKGSISRVVVKGLTLTLEKNKKIVNFEVMENMVKHYIANDHISETKKLLNTNFFHKDAMQGQVFTREMPKSYRIILDKRVLVGVNTVPFGY